MSKKIWLTITVAALLGIAWAQSGPAGSSLSFSLTSGNTCDSPAKGKAVLCGTTAGWQESHDGSTFGVLGQTGPAGPQGPVGPTGPTGPPGIPGPTPASLTCTTMTITAVGVSLSGCK